jgi:glutathione synthase/RimK-type ligase-like ATP-grasp enzyme
MHIFSYNPNSEGAKALKEALGIKRIKNEGSKFKGGLQKQVINWGATQVPNEVLKCKIINHPQKVALTSDKLKFFKHLKGSPYLPEFTESHEKALEWVGEGYWVVARTVLNGHSGAGIVLMHKNLNPKDFVKAPLYVKYIPKTEEYRVHVINGKSVDIQRKTLSKEYAEKHDKEDINWKIRNLDNGFIYQRANVNPHQSVIQAAIDTVSEIGLDFGAVDIVVHKQTGKAYVLEVNSAPGLQGTTVEIYAKALKG